MVLRHQMVKTDSLDDRIDALYRGKPDAFISARDALAKQCRTAGDVDGAAAVKALRKPTAAAWAVNRLAHAAPKEVAKLLAIGVELHVASQVAANGDSDARLRRAKAKSQKLVSDLSDRAVAFLGKSGEAQREAITKTLEAAVADPEAGLAVQRGRLVKELLVPARANGSQRSGVVESNDAASRREARRAARAARQNGKQSAITPVSDSGKTAQTDQPSSAAEEIRRQARLDSMRAIADERAAEALLAARELSAARQELSRIQDLLVTAEGRARTAQERAKLTQWASATAQDELRVEAARE